MASLVPAIEDLVTRLFNVHWGGNVAIFVAVTNAGPFRIGVKKGNPPVIRVSKIELPMITEVGIPFNFCCAYGGAFLMAGYIDYEEENDANATAACILRSTDGFEWKLVFMSERGTDFDPSTEHTSPIRSVPVALVWQDGVLYFAQNVERPGLGIVSTPTGLTAWKQEQIFYSEDGAEWLPRHAEQIWWQAELGGWRSTFPGYCTNNDCRDGLNQNVPDGVMWRDVEKRTFEIKPSIPPTIQYGFPNFIYGESNSIVSSVHGTRAVAGVSRVHCVAGRNGIWMAGGHGNGISLSFDVGKTWTFYGIDPDIAFVYTITGARGRVVDGELVVIPSTPRMQDEIPEDVG